MCIVVLKKVNFLLYKILVVFKVPPSLVDRYRLNNNNKKHIFLSNTLKPFLPLPTVYIAARCKNIRDKFLGSCVLIRD